MTRWKSWGVVCAFNLGAVAESWAQDAPNPEGQDAKGEVESSSELTDQLDALRDSAAKPAGANGAVAADRDALLAILQTASVWADERQTMEARTSALKQLGEIGDPRALMLIRAAARDRLPQIQRAAVMAAVGWGGAEAVDLMDFVMKNGNYNVSVRLAAVDALEQISVPLAGTALWRASGEKDLPTEIRTAAHKAFERGYPQMAAELGSPGVIADQAGATLTVGATALTGGILLSSVGVWGTNDVGVGIGAVGGTVIGGGAGGIYLSQNPVTRGQGLRYASNVAWGLAGGVLATEVLFPAQYDDEDSWSQRENYGAFFRAAGTVGGAVTGLKRFPYYPSPMDVLETDAAGYLGLQTVLGITDLASTSIDKEQEACWEGAQDWENESQWEEGDACEQEIWSRRNVRRSAAMLGGSAVGLGLGTMVQQAWEPTPASVAFATVIGAESAWIGGWLPTALDWDEPDGNIRTSLHAGVAGGLLYHHHQPLDEKTIGMLAYGGVIGNAFGAGVPMLASSDDEQVITAAMLPVGVAGMVAGGVVADDVELSEGDIAMIGVGTSMVMLESASIGQVLYLEEIWCDERLQAEGLVLTTGALAGTGFTYLATQTEPQMVDMFFLASSAAWGAWYGAMVPIGLDLSLSDSAHILSTTFAADAFLAGGGLALAKADGFESWQAAIPQLGGVAGATVGSLAVAMFREDESQVALGAVVGSTAGLGVGSWLQVKKGDQLGKKFQSAQSILPKPHFLEKVPGEWSAMVLPQIDPTGELGANVSISGVGW